MSTSINVPWFIDEDTVDHGTTTELAWHHKSWTDDAGRDWYLVEATEGVSAFSRQFRERSEDPTVIDDRLQQIKQPGFFDAIAKEQQS